jgi:hypothetical protein
VRLLLIVDKPRWIAKFRQLTAGRNIAAIARRAAMPGLSATISQGSIPIADSAMRLGLALRLNGPTIVWLFNESDSGPPPDPATLAEGALGDPAVRAEILARLVRWLARPGDGAIVAAQESVPTEPGQRAFK